MTDEATGVPTRLLREHPALPVVVLCFGGLVASLTQTLLIPIQTELGPLLGTTPANAAWVITVTLLAGAVAMPTAGRLADLFGKQRVIAVSALMLLLASVICALSDSLAPMLVGRAMQGLAMGFIPVGISLMREITPPVDGPLDERVKKTTQLLADAYAAGIADHPQDWHMLQKLWL